MNILVLGSAGQIGSALTEYLKKQNYNVFGYDIDSDPSQDLRISNALEEILPNVDFVFFLAFDVGGSHYLNTYQHSYDFISNNVKIMDNTFESLNKYKTPFVFASSQMANLTNSGYGVLKNIGEKYTHSLKNGKVVRFWNVYGIEKNPEKFHVITDFILMAKNDGKIKIKTTGEETRQFLYAEDCSKCLEVIAREFNEIPENELDISNFGWISIYDVARIISSQFNNCEIIRGEGGDNVQRAHLPDPRQDILKYWKPETSIVSGIKNIINSL